MEFQHEGVVIKLRHDGIFTREFPGEGFNGETKTRNYDSLAQAKESIDADINAARKSQQSQVDVTLLDEWGRTMTLRRVHEGTGDWLTGKGEYEKPRNGYLNMVFPKKLLVQREVLRAQVQEIDESLRPYSIRIPTGNGRQDADRIEHLVKRLNDALADAQTRVADLTKS